MWNFDLNIFLRENSHLFIIANIFLIFNLFILNYYSNLENPNIVIQFCLGSIILINSLIFTVMAFNIFFKSFEGRKDEDVIFNLFQIRRGDYERICILLPFSIESLLLMIFSMVSLDIQNKQQINYFLAIFFGLLIISVLFIIMYLNFIRKIKSILNVHFEDENLEKNIYTFNKWKKEGDVKLSDLLDMKNSLDYKINTLGPILVNYKKSKLKKQKK